MNKIHVPGVVNNYLRDQLLNKKKPNQKAIENTFNYWKGIWGSDLSDEDEAMRLLRNSADDIT